MIFDNSNVKIEILKDKVFDEKGITVSVLRLDQIHPVISGNKLFKLHYFLEEAVVSTHKTIITFGGAYSNHLAATAYAGKVSGLKTIGIVRGEDATVLSHTLEQCRNNGMHLKFVSREIYDSKAEKEFIQKLKIEFGESILIPEGGFDTKGAKGASLIMDLIPETTTHICCAAGTATTLAGLMLKCKTEQTIIGVPVLKGMKDLEERILFLTANQIDLAKLKILDAYHFGGYAKKTPELISFMNRLYEQFKLPTDFVYTAKMMNAITDCIKENMFPPGSNIVCLHTGGLQGNLSLPDGSLFF